MLSEDRFGFRPLWDELLHIYEEVARVCDRHGLRYFLMEGNAIGAIRHKGFVPWDDDVDIAMPRPDYEKFIQIANTELPPHLRYWDWRNQPDFNLTFGKVQDIRRNKIEEIEGQIGVMQSSGLYIDILVIDGFPSNFLAQWWYKVRMFALGSIVRRMQTRLKGQTLGGSISWILGFVLKICLPSLNTHDKVFSAIDRQMKSVPYETSKQTWRAGAAIRVTMTFPRHVWDGVFEAEFDRLIVPLPSGYDLYLKTQYGDYRAMPPVDKQKPSHSLSYRHPWWLGPQK